MSARLTPERLAMIRAHHANGMYGGGVRAAEIGDVLAEIETMQLEAAEGRRCMAQDERAIAKLRAENERLEKGARDALLVAMTRCTPETVASMITEAIAADRALRGVS